MAVRPIFLSNQSGWRALENLLRERQERGVITDNLVRHLRELGTKTVLVEEHYLDRDFSEAYSAYYAKTFRRHSKLCTRLLFFAAELDFLSKSEDVATTLSAMEQHAANTFLGYVILRPISQAPVAHVVLKPPAAPTDYEGHLLVRAPYAAHALGAEVKVDAIPMTQQDSRVGACAQAVIWVMARHFYTRHRGPWLSTVSITSAAIATPELYVNAIPAGSEFLTGNSMVAALRAAGRETLVYAGSPRQGQPPDWKQLRPADIISRYVDSGVPVLVGLHFPGQEIGHAIVATGQVLKDNCNVALPIRPTATEFCEAFYVNDDQLGANIRVGIRRGSPVAETAAYNIADNCQFLIVPLPEKVYLPAEKAEAIAWDVLANYSNDWDKHKKAHVGKLGVSERTGDEFTACIRSNEVLARTYLTYGWKYKHRGMRNKLPNSVRQLIRNLEVARFVYVTEFSTLASTVGKPKYERRIFAHCAVDATAKNQGMDSVLLFHAPGMCFWHAHDSTNKFVRSVAPIKDDEGYFPKLRGETDFLNYQS